MSCETKKQKDVDITLIQIELEQLKNKKICVEVTAFDELEDLNVTNYKINIERSNRSGCKSHSIKFID